MSYIAVTETRYAGRVERWETANIESQELAEETVIKAIAMHKRYGRKVTDHFVMKQEAGR